MKKGLFALTAIFAGLHAMAQDDIAAHFDMEVSASGTIQENVSGKSVTVNHALPLESVEGAVGRAWRLDGYSDFVKAAVEASRFNTSTLSVSLWCAPETYPVMSDQADNTLSTIIAGNIDETQRGGFAFTLTQQGQYGFICYTGGWKVELKADAKLMRYQWNHLVATIDTENKKVTLYNNGEKVAESKCMSPVNPGNDSFWIGKSAADIKQGPFFMNTFNGLIDDITIYNRVLSSQEISSPQAEHEAGLAIPASRFAMDWLRPSFHGMPAAGWTNECHGALFYNGQYHLFFQKNANGPYMARLHWGHIYSDNLYKWQEDHTAISPDESYDLKGCWSGCVFSDENLYGGKPTILYTGVDNAKASINAASPLDESLSTWAKEENNPIIPQRPAGLSDDFRDPYFFTDDGKKYIIAGTSKNGLGATTLHRYDASTGKWSNDGSIFFSGTDKKATGTFWEMPNITRIGNKWLFTVTPLNTANGVETLYWTGTVNADGTFSPTSSSVSKPAKLELDGFSKDGFGLLSPTIFQHEGKTILLGIVPDKLSSEENYKLGWAHTYSLPREISIDENGLLIQKPFSGLAAMRTSTSFSINDYALNGSLDLTPVNGRKYEIEGTFTVGNARFGYDLFKNGTKSAKLYYDPAGNKLVVDATSLNRLSNDKGVFDGYYASELPRQFNKGEKLSLHVFVDHSILDVFINDTWAFSMRLFPADENATGLSAFADGETEVSSLNAWILDENKNETGAVEALKNSEDIKVNGRDIVYNNLSGNACLQICSLDGNILHDEKMTAGQGTVRFHRSGLYIVRTIQDGKITSKKIIIK